MGKTTFRAMTVADADAAAELDLKCFGERDAFDRNYFLWVAEDELAIYIVGERDGKIVACAGAEIFSDTAEIESVAVDPDCRRQGLGNLILTRLISAIKARGVTFVILEVRPSNTAAIKLYENFGFRIVEREKNFYGDEDALIMARNFDL